MKQPDFSNWTWQLVALAIPLAAAVCGTMAANQSRDELAPLVVAFTILGAGNGYLMAAAIGDFGRSLIAIPVGAFAAFAAVHCLQVPVLRGIYFAFICIYLMVQFAQRALNETAGVSLVLAGFAVPVALLCILGVSLSIALEAQRGLSVLGVVLCYPCVCSAITAAMPMEETWGGRFRAMLTGVVSACWGMALGAIAFGCALIFLPVMGFLFRRGFPEGVYIAAAALLATNYFCVRTLFRGAVRVEPAKPVESVPASGANATPPRDTGDSATMPASQASGERAPTL